MMDFPKEIVVGMNEEETLYIIKSGRPAAFVPRFAKYHLSPAPGVAEAVERKEVLEAFDRAFDEAVERWKPKPEELVDTHAREKEVDRWQMVRLFIGTLRAKFLRALSSLGVKP